MDTTPSTPSFWLPVLAGLPITLCMVVMGLPDIGNGHSAAFRALYTGAYIVWVIPLSVIQRRMWRTRVAWWKAALVLLGITYAMSVLNNAIALHMAVGWHLVPSYQPMMLLRGLDGCWLALIAYCAIHAVVAYYTELRQAQERTAQAISHARDAELRALRYQLNPHFLFNTLNAISALVAKQQNREANRMIARLGDFLRATLDSDGAHEVTLAEELSLTETYLDVEKARLGDRLVIRLQVGPEVMSAMVPYLLLQPLVENAIRHGISMRREPGKLELGAHRQGDMLSLCVTNEGQPATERIDQPGTSLTVGLNNVRARLATLYPGAHQLRTKAGEDGGFLVAIDIPFREKTAEIVPRKRAS
jgi:two-component system sensor histidine kinase AlgZ